MATHLSSSLARHHWTGLPQEWRFCVTDYTLGLRVPPASRTTQPTDLVRELMSSAHTWNPLLSESLLLEVEQELLIRKVQDDFASEMRDPQDGHSSVV